MGWWVDTKTRCIDQYCIRTGYQSFDPSTGTYALMSVRIKQGYYYSPFTNSPSQCGTTLLQLISEVHWTTPGHNRRHIHCRWFDIPYCDVATAGATRIYTEHNHGRWNSLGESEWPIWQAFNGTRGMVNRRGVPLTNLPIFIGKIRIKYCKSHLWAPVFW
jgi:hypothetical protein